MKRLLVFLAIPLFISGCVSFTGNIKVDEYSDAKLKRSSIKVGKKQLQGQKANVFVKVNLEKGKIIASNKDILLGRIIANTATELEKKGITFTNVKAAGEKEINEEQLIKSIQSAGNQIKNSNYILDFTIKKASIKSETSKDWKLLKDSKQTYTCEFAGKVKIAAKIYKTKGNKLITTIDLEDSESRDFTTENKKDCVTRAGKEKSKLVVTMAEDAVNKSVTNIANYLAAKGRVLTKKAKKQETIFKISVGENHGVREGDSVNIYSAKSLKDNKKKENKIEPIATGQISNVINENTCWISVTKSDGADNIRYADHAHISYERGVLSHLKYLFD